MSKIDRRRRRARLRAAPSPAAPAAPVAPSPAAAAAAERARRGEALGLAPVAGPRRREPNGQPSRRPSEGGDRRDPRTVVLEARARRAGLAPGKDARRTMNDPRRGTAMGAALIAARERGLLGAAPAAARREFARRAEAFEALARAEWVYHHLVLGVPLTAQGVAITVVPEALEARPDDRPDTRTPDERARDAAEAWDAWRARLGRLPRRQAGMMLAATRDDLDGLVTAGPPARLTIRGLRAVVALGRLADALEADTRRARRPAEAERATIHPFAGPPEARP